MKKSVLFLFISVIVVIQGFGQDYSYDKKIGAENAKQVPLTMGIYNDSILTAYVTSVGERLVNQADNVPLDFNFHIVDMQEPNAFALPGGYIYVTRGVLSLVNDESELACVMGHEMIHAIERHSVKQMKKKILPGLLQIPGAIVGIVNPNLGNLINTPLQVGSSLFLSSYSRSQEKEADRLGVDLASKAGYDPAKLAVILESLQKDVETLTGEEEKKSYFSSHPYTPKRVSYLDKEVSKLNWTPKEPIADSKKELFGLLKGMCYGDNPEQGVFKENTFLHPDMNFTITFPDKWKTQNIPVAVGAMQPDGGARVVLQLADTVADPDSLGIDFVNKFKKKYKQSPKQNKHIEINGNPGYMVMLNDNSSGKSIDMFLYWIKMDDVLYNIQGLGYSKYSNTIQNCVQTFRHLTKEEKNGITSLSLDFAQVKAGETLEAFSKRTGNKWSNKITAVMNGLHKGEKLQEGEYLKIAVEKPYVNSKK
jgi:predicted Zn-dependent protease